VEKELGRIKAVVTLHTETSRERRYVGKHFVDCTGHGSIGFLAGADYDIAKEDLLGMSNMWRWEDTGQPQSFPEITWALSLDMDDFPYPKRFHGEWFWESGYSKDPIKDLEYTRDWNLRAVFGAWNAMKNRGGKTEHVNAKLQWIAYIGGTRESRRLMGDVVLTQDDIVTKKDFPDGCVPSTWTIDLHYPRKEYIKEYPSDPFIAVAVHDQRIDRNFGYPVPYRCFYSRNIPNLFMAGRCISVTHEALGTVRVMRTGGMMGEVVGKAASICVKNGCDPRDVYQRYWSELDELLRLPGRARRVNLDRPFELPGPPPPPVGDAPAVGINPASLAGLIVDDPQARVTGNWSRGTGLKDFIGSHYLYHQTGGKGAVRFEFKVQSSGDYEVRLAVQPHENRATNARITVQSAAGEKVISLNMRTAAPVKGFVSLGRFRFDAAQAGAVVISTEGADGFVHADAIQILPAE